MNISKYKTTTPEHYTYIMTVLSEYVAKRESQQVARGCKTKKENNNNPNNTANLF